MYTTYVLELEGGKIYVGKTENLPTKLKQHFAKDGAYLTKDVPAVKFIASYKGDVVDELCNHGINHYGIKHSNPKLIPDEFYEPISPNPFTI